MADRSNWEGMYVALGEGTQDVYIREAMYVCFFRCSMVVVLMQIGK